MPLMKKAEKGETALLFMDAPHFVMGCGFPGGIYGKARRFVRTFSGRVRYNVLGAMDFVTKSVLTVANDSYITATEVCRMLDKISVEYKDRAVHVILDNARYQKCKAVTEPASRLDIHLEYIPPLQPKPQSD